MHKNEPKVSPRDLNASPSMISQWSADNVRKAPISSEAALTISVLKISILESVSEKKNAFLWPFYFTVYVCKLY